MLELYHKVVCTLRRKNLSSAARSVLDEEEARGARVSNAFRYGLVVFLGIQLVYSSFSAGVKEGWLINMSTLAIYLLITIAHTLLLRRNIPALLHAASYVTAVVDVVIIAIVIHAWMMLVKQNYVYFVKSTIFIYILLPIALTIFQFRIRLLFITLLSYFLIWGAAIIAAIQAPDALTTDWVEYVMGSRLVLHDIIGGRTIPFLGLATALAYTTYRSLAMIERIGTIELQKMSLARYFSPDVASELLKAGEEISGGRRQKATILFSDIRNFTAFSEKMDPAMLAEMLTDFRDRMTRVIFKHGGTLDKYIGDAIMAVFGAPFQGEDDAKNALAAGLEMLLELKSINVLRQREGLPDLAIGIGLHTGEVFAGSLGQQGRLEYTVIGDAVNTASRIESLTKKLGQPMIFSEAVLSEVPESERGQLRLLKLPRVKVKGKEEPLVLFSMETGAG